MIYSGDRFPGTVNEMTANVMADFGAHNKFTQVREMEELLLERIHAAVLRLKDGDSEEDCDLEQATRETISERMTDAFGNGKKRGRKSNYFNFADDLPSIRSSPRKGNGVNLKETKMFSLITVLKAPGEAQNLARDLFDVSRDDVPHSTRLEANKTRDEHVRDRRRSRSREPDTDGSVSRRTSRSRSGSRVQFNPGPSQNRAASTAGTNTLAAQCVLNITNPEETQWPLATSVHRLNPDFTQAENEMMDVTEEMPENERLTKRSDYIKYYAVYSAEHGTAALIDQIKDKIEESSILYNQSPKDIEGWKAPAIKDFAKEYKEIQNFNKALKDTSQKLLSRMNECIESETISELCWKVGKSAMKAVDTESKRLLELIKTNNMEMNKRNISRCDKDIKVTYLKDMVGTFSGEDLAKSVDARTFQQFKKELEDSFEHYQVDKNNWGFYTKAILTGEAKETLEREMPGETNPDYNKLMAHLQRYHGRAKDVLTAIKRRQLLLNDITSNTSPRQKQEICKHHRTCFDKIKGVLNTTKENVGMMREHMIKVLLKFPDHHRYEIKKLLDDDSKPNLDEAIDAFQALCRDITDMAQDESCNEGFDAINQSFSAMTPNQSASFKPRPRQDKPSFPIQAKTFSLTEVEPADCKVCKQLHAYKVEPLSASKTHVVTSYNTPVTDACPNLVKLSTENKEKKAKLIKLCRRCGREYLDATHSEQKCSFNARAIQCADDKCQLLAAYCGQHREKNIPIHEIKQKRLKKLGLHYNFSCQVVRKGSQEEGYALHLPTKIRYTYENLKQMMKCQDPRTTISSKEGMPIFPMGLMWTPAGGAVSYGYDGGASMSSVLLGSEGTSFHTAPVSGNESDWQTISCAAGYINVRLAYILIGLIDGSMARIKVQLIDYTMECQTRNLKQLTRGLESEAKAAGVMKEGEQIQYPVYQSKAVLLLGRSHAHLAPKLIYTNESGLSLYEGCIAGPYTSRGPSGQERTLCVGGSLVLKQESKETLNKAGQDEGMEQCVNLLREAALANERVMSANQTLLSEEAEWNKESSEHSSNDCWEDLCQSPHSEFSSQDNIEDADQLMVNEEVKKWGPKYRRRNGSPTLYYSSN